MGDRDSAKKEEGSSERGEGGEEGEEEEEEETEMGEEPTRR
jgi:hypothetical protein